MSVVCEDQLTEMFIRRLLVRLGCNPRRLTFKVAPNGTGSAEAWVRSAYCDEVRSYRRDKYQQGLTVLAVIDGDSHGVKARRQELATRLAEDGQAPVGDGDRIGALVPTWSIESWILSLLGDPVTEVHSFKVQFKQGWDRNRKDACDQAIKQWRTEAKLLPSRQDAVETLARLLPS